MLDIKFRCKYWSTFCHDEKKFFLIKVIAMRMSSCHYQIYEDHTLNCSKSQFLEWFEWKIPSRNTRLKYYPKDPSKTVLVLRKGLWRPLEKFKLNQIFSLAKAAGIVTPDSKL